MAAGLASRAIFSTQFSRWVLALSGSAGFRPSVSLAPAPATSSVAVALVFMMKKFPSWAARKKTGGVEGSQLHILDSVHLLVLPYLGLKHHMK